MSTKRVQMGGYPYNKDTHGPLDSSSEDSDSDDSDASNKKGPPNFLLGACTCTRHDVPLPLRRSTAPQAVHPIQLSEASQAT